MSSFSTSRFLGLPHTPNGQILTCSLIASLALSVTHLALTAPSVGYWQIFVTFAAAPVTIIHHITIFVLLRKNPANSPYVPDCLTRKLNIAFLALFDALWISGTIVGLYLWSWLHDSSDDYFPPLALVSNIFALVECLVLGAVVVFCGIARSEKLMGLRGVHEIDEAVS